MEVDVGDGDVGQFFEADQGGVGQFGFERLPVGFGDCGDFEQRGFPCPALKDRQAAEQLLGVGAEAFEREAQAHQQRVVAFHALAGLDRRQQAFVFIHQLLGRIIAQLRQGQLQRERVAVQKFEQAFQRQARRARQAVRLQNGGGQVEGVGARQAGQFFVAAVGRGGEGRVGQGGVAGGDQDGGLLIADC